MIKLILVRHALTTDNEDKKLSGHIDSCLSKYGIEQVENLTKYLENTKVDSIYTTTSSRTKDTVKEIAKKRGIMISERELLKEINFGDFEGKTFEDIKINYPNEFNKIIELGYEYKYPNGESLIDSYKRVSIEIDNIISENDGKEVLICSHGGTIRNIISYLVTNSYEYHWNFKIDNASVTIIDIVDGFAVINMMNNTCYI